MSPKRVNYNVEKQSHYKQQFVNDSNVQYNFVHKENNVKEKNKNYLDMLVSEVKLYINYINFR